jgi:hypothetical protein
MKEIAMPEVLTCVCGAQDKWTLYSTQRIKCNECDTEYDLGEDPLDASDFNKEREELRV